MTAKRILTIDGGGLRGVFSAAIIEQMEQAGGRPAAEIFDCIGGTSAGSLLAAGLACGLPAAELKKAFLKLGDVAFGRGGESSKETRSESLKGLLKDMFGDKRPSDCITNLVIPARNMQIGKTVFFGTLPHERAFDETVFSVDDLPENEPLWKTVHRSTALPPHFAPSGNYLDGGISPFANPSYGTFLGVKQWFDWDAEQMDLHFHSVGTGYHRSHITDLPALSDTRLYGEMVHAMIQDISLLQHLIMKRRRDEKLISYKRYNLRFDKAGFNELGLPPPTGDFEKLASTNETPLEELAAIGTAVGRIKVQACDFVD